VRRDLGWVDVEDFLRALEIKFTRSGDEFTYQCFGDDHSNGDRNPSGRINANTTLFLCHKCGLRGDAVAFLSKLKDLSESEALRVLEERYGGAEKSVEEGGLSAEVERIMAPEKAAEISTRIPPSEEFVQSCCLYDRVDMPRSMATASYMIGRGFEPCSLRRWQIGYDEISGRMMIPVRDAGGNLVGIKGRAIDARQPKYMVLGDSIGSNTRYGFNTYRKSDVVFGLDKIDKEIRHGVLIVEGELNAIALAQIGRDAISVAGSEFSPRQAELIIQHIDSAIVCFDWDDAGRAGAGKVVAALEDFMPLRVVTEAPGDAAEMWQDYLPYIDCAVSPLTALLG